MKKVLAFVFFICFSFLGRSQVVFRDTVDYNPLPKNSNSYSLFDTITNTTSNPIVFTWSKQSHQLLNGVSCLSIMDDVSCFSFSDSNTHTFTIAPGAEAFIAVEAKASAGADNGNSYVTILTNYGPMVFRFVTMGSTSVPSVDKLSLEVYPNPANDFLRISGSQTLNVDLQIWTAEGHIVQRLKAPTDHIMDIRSLDKGVYYLQWIDHEVGDQFFKFVKQ